MEGAVSDVAVCNLAFAGRLEELRALLLRDRAQATRADQDHRTALHWACSAGHTDVADLLLGLGVPVNDKDDAGWTPLHIAASAGRDEIVKALIAKGAHVNAVNQNGCTPLHYAASKNKQEIAVMLLENGADPDATDHFESTPLHRAAAKGNLKMVQILVQHNATVDIRDSEGNTPLEQFESVRVTAALNLVTKPQWNPDFAVNKIKQYVLAVHKPQDGPGMHTVLPRTLCQMEKNICCICTLLSAEPNPNPKNCLNIARRTAGGMFLSCIMTAEGLDSKLWNLSSHLACDEERVEEAKLLVSHGASIHIENKEELTPLKVAKGGLGAILKRMVEG